MDPNTLMDEFSYNSMFLFTEGVLEKEFNDKFNLSYFEELDNNSGRISEKLSINLRIVTIQNFL